MSNLHKFTPVKVASVHLNTICSDWTSFQTRYIHQIMQITKAFDSKNLY